MNYLLDTCVISELAKPSPNKKLMKWLSGVSTERLYLCVVTTGEIRRRLTRLPDSRQKESFTRWFNTLLEDYQERILHISRTVAENWGLIQGNAEKGNQPMSSMNSLMAAVAYTHNLAIVTRNSDDFATGHVPVHNPWTAWRLTGDLDSMRGSEKAD
jgi:toxin FitB